MLYPVVSYLIYESFSGFITSVGEERTFFLPSITCNYVISVRWSFLFLLALGIVYFLNPEVPALSHILWPYDPACVAPVRKHRGLKL